MPFKPILCARRNFQGLPFSAIWSERLGQWARCWQTRWELTSGDIGDITLATLPTCHSEIAIIWKRTFPAYFGNFIVLEFKPVQCPGPGSLTSSSHHHTLGLCLQNTIPCSRHGGAQVLIHYYTTSQHQNLSAARGWLYCYEQFLTLVPSWL